MPQLTLTVQWNLLKGFGAHFPVNHWDQTPSHSSNIKHRQGQAHVTPGCPLALQGAWQGAHTTIPTTLSSLLASPSPGAAKQAWGRAGNTPGTAKMPHQDT